MMGDPHAVDGALAEHYLDLLTEFTVPFLEDVKFLIVRSADHHAIFVVHGHGIGKHSSRGWFDLGGPLGNLITELAEPDKTVIADRRDFTVLVGRDVVEADVASSTFADLIETCSALRVPNQDRPVERACQDPLPVRSPIEGAFPGGRLALQRDFLAEVFGIPDKNLLIIGCRKDVAVDRRRRHLLDARCMRGDLGQGCRSGNVEDANHAVVASQHRPPMNRIDGTTVGFILERSPHLDQFAGAQVPDAERHVVARGVDATIAVDNRQDVLFVTFDHARDRAGVEVPNQNPPVAGHRNAGLVVDKHKVFDVVAVTQQDLLPLSLRQIPNVDRIVRRRGSSQRSLAVDGDLVDQVIVIPEQLHGTLLQIHVRGRPVIRRTDRRVRTWDPGHACHGPSMPNKFSVTACVQQSSSSPAHHCLMECCPGTALRCLVTGPCSSTSRHILISVLESRLGFSQSLPAR